MFGGTGFLKLDAGALLGKLCTAELGRSLSCKSKSSMLSTHSWEACFLDEVTLRFELYHTVTSLLLVVTVVAVLGGTVGAVFAAGAFGGADLPDMK